MKKRSVSMLGVAAALLVLLGSCVSPLTSLTQGTSSLPALGAKDVRLVFNTSSLTPALNKSAEGATYLTVTLESVADGTVKFASATEASGVYTVTVGGMVGGEWKIKARFWDDNVNKALMFYGNTKETIVPGQAKSVNLVVYPVGSIGSVSVFDALMPTHVTLLGQDGLPSNASDKKLGIGSSWSLDGIAYYSGDDSTPASNPAVQWSSSDEKVAVVSASGRVSVLGLGTTEIKATSSIDPTITAIYRIEGVSPVYGTWKFTFNDYEYDSLTQTQVLRGRMSWVYRFDNATFKAYTWDTQGEIQAVRGSYAVNGGLLTMKGTQQLDTSLNPPQWGPYTNSDPDQLFTAEVHGDSLLMTPLFTLGQGMSSMMSTSRDIQQIMPTMVLFRAGEKTVSGVTVDGSSTAFTLYQGARLTESAIAVSPVDADVAAVVWTSAGAAVVGPLGVGGPLGGVAQGMTQVKAYPLDADFDGTPVSLSSLDATVVANDAPTVTPNSSPYTNNKTDPTFTFTISDASGLAQVSWKVIEMNSENQSEWGSGSLSNVVGTSQNLSVSNYSYALTDGHYQIRITAVDRQGFGVGAPYTFDFWVDTMPPAISSTNFDHAEVQTGQSNPMTITFTDGLSGIAAGSFSVVGAQVTLSLYNSGTSSYDAFSPGVTGQSLTENEGSFQLDLSVLDNAIYPRGFGSVEVQIADNAGNMTTINRTITVGYEP